MPSVLLEEDPAEISGILEARHGQMMKRLLEMDDGPAPSPAQVAFWELLLDAMGEDAEEA